MNGNDKDAPQSYPSAALGIGEALISRKRLLISLLSDREAVRVICAPPLYGKTVLANQYARIAFPPASVTWIQASEPEFLVNLDSGNIEEALDSDNYSPGKLVVFDGISKLKGKRRTSLVTLMGKLHTKQCEVMVTTEDSTLAADVELPVVVLDAREMALSSDELPKYQDHSDNHESLFEKGHMPTKRSVPPVALDKERGADRFLKALLRQTPSSPEESLAYLALFFGSGSLSQITDFFDERTQPDISLVESLFPFAGVRLLSSSFSAFELTVEARHELMAAHYSSIVPFTRFEDEAEFLLACVDSCLVSGKRALASMAFESRKIQQWYAEKHGPETANLSLPIPANEHSFGEGGASADAVKTETTSPVRIDLFGRCEVTRDGESVLSKGELRRKAKLVIALLVVNDGKELPRTWIERIVWPESDPACVRSSFYNLWSYIRRILTPPGEEPFGSRRSRDTVSLAGLNYVSDVGEVHAQCLLLNGCTDPDICKRALGKIERLYCGPLLPGVQNDQVDAYRITYQNRVLDALVDGVRALIRVNELRLAQHYAEFAFAIDQTREDVVYQYMKVQQLLGQFAGAISTFVSCRRALVDRFGIDGSSRLEELYEEILEEVSASGASAEPFKNDGASLQ
jgi:DNA-binding SARP family transcriptional activator